LAWLGLAWLGLAWLGLAWLGLAWLGSANPFADREYSCEDCAESTECPRRSLCFATKASKAFAAVQCSAVQCSAVQDFARHHCCSSADHGVCVAGTFRRRTTSRAAASSGTSTCGTRRSVRVLSARPTVSTRRE
jgi:Tfp pilus assembly protein PilX